MIELKTWLQGQGAQTDDLPGCKQGRDRRGRRGSSSRLTNAFHSSSERTTARIRGEAAGIVVELEDGKKVYFAGDTCVFGDMQLIGRLYSPDVAVLPIGGHFTMDPREAALACELLGVEARRAVPLRNVPAPGGHARRAQAARPRRRRRGHRARGVDSRCERALVRCDGAPRAGNRGRGRARARRRARPRRRLRCRADCARHTKPGGRSSFERARPKRSRCALSHPEVAAALVPADRRDLLELDLRELTYGP